MTTIGDIRAARAAHEEHVATHKCRPGECELRKRLWLHYQKTAERWGQE